MYRHRHFRRSVRLGVFWKLLGRFVGGKRCFASSQAEEGAWSVGEGVELA